MREGEAPTVATRELRPEELHLENLRKEAIKELQLATERAQEIVDQLFESLAVNHGFAGRVDALERGVDFSVNPDSGTVSMRQQTDAELIEFDRFALTPEQREAHAEAGRRAAACRAAHDQAQALIAAHNAAGARIWDDIARRYGYESNEDAIDKGCVMRLDRESGIVTCHRRGAAGGKTDAAK